jgi:hypothetical protein
VKLKVLVVVAMLCSPEVAALEPFQQLKPLIPTADSLKERYESSRNHLIETGRSDAGVQLCLPADACDGDVR